MTRTRISFWLHACLALWFVAPAWQWHSLAHHHGDRARHDAIEACELCDGQVDCCDENGSRGGSVSETNTSRIAFGNRTEGGRSSLWHFHPGREGCETDCVLCTASRAIDLDQGALSDQGRPATASTFDSSCAVCILRSSTPAYRSVRGPPWGGSTLT